MELTEYKKDEEARLVKEWERERQKGNQGKWAALTPISHGRNTVVHKPSNRLAGCNTVLVSPPKRGGNRENDTIANA